MESKIIHETAITVDEAYAIVLSRTGDFGTEEIPFADSVGRIIAEDVLADRDYPPYDRITMDGIAIRHEALGSGITQFHIAGMQAAGDNPLEIMSPGDCIEVMTGSALPVNADAVIRYEDVITGNGNAFVQAKDVKYFQNIHRRGSDISQGNIIVTENSKISAAAIAVIASVGKINVKVRKYPRILIISTGNEIVEPAEKPDAFQIRNSNRFVISAALKDSGITPVHFHLPDDPVLIRERIEEGLQHADVIIFCGGVSKGKFDFVHTVLEEAGAEKLFHTVLQRPGKPFWFGTLNSKPVFAFPGNPVSVFLCYYRYFMPWLLKSMHEKISVNFAILSKDVEFKPSLNYFIPVSLVNSEGRMLASPVDINNSGDFSNLMRADAFMELPKDRSAFRTGDVFPVWPFKNNFK